MFWCSSRESVLSLAQAAEQMPLSSPESRSYGPRAPRQSGLLHRLLLILTHKRLSLMLYFTENPHLQPPDPITL